VMLGAVVVLMPLNQRLIPLAIVLWLAASIFVALRNKARFIPSQEFFLPIAIYLVYSLGLLWSDNMYVAVFDLEVKSSLLLVPLMFMFVRYDTSQIRIIFFGLFLGLLFAMAVLTVEAAFKFVESQNTGEFFYTSLSHRIHPSYLSYFLNIAISILLLDYFFKHLQLFKRKSAYLALILAFLFFSVLLASKSGIITSMLLLSALMTFWIVKRRWKMALVSLSLGIAVLFAINFKSPFIKERMTEMFDLSGESEDGKYYYTTALRMAVWRESVQLLLEKPLTGHGTGDVRDALMERYEREEMSQVYDLRLNPHNQFLQTGIAIGIVGLMLLIVLLVRPIFGFRRKFQFTALFSVITIVFFLTESVLETQAGVVAFILFYCLFTATDKNLQSRNETSDSHTVLST
jgi:O-antigen ligase